MDQDNSNESVNKLANLIKGIKMAMFISLSKDGFIHSRPMATQELEFDGDLWFFTSIDSEKIIEIKYNSHVNVSYADIGTNKYISVSGDAEVVEDKNKIKQLWNPTLKIWFPNGSEDPKLTLIKVNVTNAEYWDTPQNAVVKLVGFVKAITTGKSIDLGENKKVSLN